MTKVLLSWQRPWPLWLRLLIGPVAVLGAAGLAVVIISVLPSLLTRHPSRASDPEKAIKDTRTVLVAAVVAWSPGIHGPDVSAGREGNFTDPYSKAVEQLGNKEKARSPTWHLRTRTPHGGQRVA